VLLASSERVKDDDDAPTGHSTHVPFFSNVPAEQATHFSTPETFCGTEACPLAHTHASKPIRIFGLEILVVNTGHE